MPDYYQTEDDMAADLVEGIYSAAYFIGSAYILPFLALFFSGAVEQQINIDKVGIYSSAIMSVYLTFMFIKLAVYFLRTRGYNIEIPVIFHDPEFSPVRSLRLFRDMRFVILLMFIISSILVISGTAQTGLIAEQQVTDTGQLIFATYPAAPSETLLLMGILSFILALEFLLYFKVIRKRIKLPLMAIFIFNLLLFSIVGSYYGEYLHEYRYGASDIDIGKVRLFWGISGFSTAATGSIIPALVLHDVNNAVVQSRTLFTSTIANTYVFIVLGIAIVLMALLLFSKREETLTKSHSTKFG